VRKHLARTVGAAAAGLGHAVSLGRIATRYVPGWLGAALVSWGAAMAWLPLGLMVAGGFLIAMDALIPARGRGGE